MEKESRTPIRRIAIVGPESTGKTTLCQDLAAHFKVQWVPEFARKYLEDRNGKYREPDLLTIAKGQIADEDALAKAATRYLFCDTNLLVIKIWSEHAFGRCDPWVLEEYSRRKYDLILLTNTDLPWSFDPLREHPNLRDYFMNWYRQELEKSGAEYKIVSGTVNIERLDCALKHIHADFNN